MNIEGFAIFFGFIIALAITIWGLFTQRASLFIGGIACVVALLGSLGAWYSWMETKSVPWTVAYAILCLVALVSAIRQFIKRASASP